MSPAPSIGVCLVVHSPGQVKPLVRRYLHLRREIGLNAELVVIVSASSGMSPSEVHASCRGLGAEPTDCTVVDDRFYDFSAYQSATKIFRKRGLAGALFVNDTLPPKHDSTRLRATLAKQVASACAAPAAFPVLIGPYRHSEFSIGTGSADDFVASFMFFLNAAGLELLTNLLESLPSVLAAVEGSEQTGQNIDESLLRLCHMHAVQLAARFTGTEGGDRLRRKLVTVYAERALSVRVKIEGVVWYTASGLAGRLLVPLQVTWNRFRQYILPGR